MSGLATAKEDTRGTIQRAMKARVAESVTTLRDRVQARDRLGKGVEAFPQHEIEPLPLRCQKHHAWVPLKKPETDPILKQPNLMADRCRRNR
jgi:hypothetical protein